MSSHQGGEYDGNRSRRRTDHSRAARKQSGNNPNNHRRLQTENGTYPGHKRKGDGLRDQGQRNGNAGEYIPFNLVFRNIGQV